jgi:CheY-like chemotaxis protein
MATLQASDASILLVDDQPGNLLVLQAILEPLGHPLAMARSGKEALRHILTQDFALVLIDVDMPVMDGLETALLIKQRERSRYTPIIFITAKGVDDPAFLQAYTTGAVDFLPKPINPTVLRSKVTVFVDLYEQRQQIARQSEMLQRIEYDRVVREREALKTQMEKKHYAELASVLERQRQLLADVLVSVTEGRLRLCERRRDLPTPLIELGKPISLRKPEALRVLRHDTREAAESRDFSDQRCQDLLTAVSEAAMNAIVHAGGGKARICGGDGESVQVWISDQGPGISIEKLPRATLERGFSTSGTLGHGFWLMLNTADRIFLLTTKTGTTIVLEQCKTEPAAIWA